MVRSGAQRPNETPDNQARAFDRDPSPTQSYLRLKRGFVGYMVRGCFELLFDANGPLGDRILGEDVPEDFEPLPQKATLARSRLRPPIDIFMQSKKSLRISASAEAST